MQDVQTSISNRFRWGHWAIITLASILAWTLMILAAVWKGPFLVLFFPAGWSLYVAFRQYRAMRNMA